MIGGAGGEGNLTPQVASRQEEARLQIAITNWARLNKDIHPELGYLMHVRNGGKLAGGAREGAMWKAMGVIPGVPDLFLPAPRGNFHGYWIELKSSTGKLSKEQREMALWLRSQGYKVQVISDFDDAKASILHYLSLSAPIALDD